MVDIRDVLKEIPWEEGKQIRVAQSYRHAIAVGCASDAPHRATFANGEFPYFARMELVDGNNQWISHGSNIVPVLPDGRIIMVIVQRWALDMYPDRPLALELDRGRIQLERYDSVEFPGGTMEPGEVHTTGLLRELQEESGVPEQTALLYRRVPPVHVFGPDLSLAVFYGVIYLQNISFPDYVENDGGLRVLALSEREIERNIRNGVINGGASMLISWGFYQELKQPKYPLMRDGYVAKEFVRLV